MNPELNPEIPAKKVAGLRRRWLTNTVAVVAAVGLACVFAVTAAFAAYYYSNIQSDMYSRAKTTTEFFADYLNQSYNAYYQSCITYAKTFEDRERLELQFISTTGRLVASSHGTWAIPNAATPEISEAIAIRAPRPYVGKDPTTGERKACPQHARLQAVRVTKSLRRSSPLPQSRASGSTPFDFVL